MKTVAIDKLDRDSFSCRDVTRLMPFSLIFRPDVMRC